ncbi:oligopeptide transporter 3 [Cocos nucifera]|uniref:Oligopeptide transporter 3 n=1 Tax=Cocos nucifera TaxID=13894 RepID=A0A8K0ITN9_COCNU|nr:oligopeptide transporter 3 [Cocos nucifera]
MLYPISEEQKEEEKKEQEEKKEEGTEEKKEEEPPDIVLKVYMHCVEDVKIDSRSRTVVVKGKGADPIKICERIQKKTGKKVELISPIPKPPEEEKKEEPPQEEKKEELLGYGWAGMMRKFLVDPVEMWWPSTLAQVSLFRALHEKDSPSKGPSRIKFFMIFFVGSFLYYVLPGYLFPILTFFSWVCWVWPHSITAQQIGSGYHGLGIGAFTLDWAGISAYHGSPLVTPWFSIINTAVGFIMFIYIIVPLCYWKYNTFDARKFPIFSNQLFASKGQKYDTTKVLTPQYDLNEAAYDSYGKLYLSPLFAISIGSGFARFTATLTHVFLFHGSDMWRRSKSAMKSIKLDVHAKLMKKYKEVPQWWFLILLAGSIVLSLLMSFVWKEQVQLPWWGLLFAFGLAWLVTLPIGVIQATTNQMLNIFLILDFDQQPGYDIIAQFLIGYVLPGTIVAAIVNLAVAWWMLENIENICDTDVLPSDSPWTCPKYRVTFDATVIWGLIGPSRLFAHGGLYRNLVWLFLIGAFLPVPIWLLSKMYPKKKWIPLINIPVISYGFQGMPPATPTNIASWLITGTIFNYFVFRFRKEWWRKYNYVLSAALDAGTAFMGVLLFLALQNQNIHVHWWGTEVDHCPLASCPTEPGIVVKGCPVF